MRAFVPLIAISPLFFGVNANGADRKLLEELPDRLHAAAVKSVEQPCRQNSGNSASEADAITREKQYDEALVRMMRDIVKAFPDITTRESVDNFVEATREVYKFRGDLAKLSRPKGSSSEFFSGSAAADFQRVIEEMVVRATEGDESFDYQLWKKRWEAAKDPCS